MKNLIMCFAILILMMNFSVYQQDSNAFLLAQESLKYQADDMAATAVLFYLPDEYAEGIKVFDDATANHAVAVHIEKNMNLTDGVVNQGYFRENEITYHVYYFDDSLWMRKYTNGSLVQKETFAYGDLFEESLTGYHKLITEPSAIVTIEGGQPKYRLSMLKEAASPMIQTSAYEYVGR